MSYQAISENPEAFPNAFKWESDHPVGGDILSITTNKHHVWISTYRGLFCYDLKLEKWSSHILPSANVHTGREMIITDESIYTHGYWNANQAWPWSVIDRKNNEIKKFYGNNANTWIKSYKKNPEEIISATPKGMYIYNYKTNIIRRIPTPSPIRQVCFDENGYLAANSHCIYQIDMDGTINAFYTFHEPFTDEKLSKSPGLMERGEGSLWFASIHMSYNEFLTHLNLKSGKETRYYIKDDIVKIIPGTASTWIIGKKNLYKYDEEKDMLLCGVMRESNGRQDYSHYFEDAIIHQGNVIITGSKKIYAIDIETMEVSENKRRQYKNYPPKVIRYYDHKIFLASAVGVYQYDEHRFMDEFIPAANLKFTGSDSWKETLPYNLRDTVRLNKSGHESTLVFSLEDEVSGLIFKQLRPTRNLSANLGSVDMQIDGVLFVSSEENKNIFQITIYGDEFEGKSELLKVYFTNNDGSKTLVRKWFIEK